MLFLHDVVEASNKIKGARKRKEKVSHVMRLLQVGRGREISLAADYLSGQIPQGRLGVGWAMLAEALKGLSDNPRSLSLNELDKNFEALSALQGPKSIEKKIGLMREILSGADERGKDFLSGLIMEEIRQGALQGLVLEAIAQASSISSDHLRQALMFSGHIGEVAWVALEEGVSGLSRFNPQLFRPIAPMLANTVEEETDALSRLGEAGWEYKIDGARVQVHKRGEDVHIFSRHLREITESIPEIVTLARKFPMEQAIFEGEAVALRADGKPLPFQTTMRRFGRIQEREKMAKELPLTPFFFDLLYVDGDTLLNLPYKDRFHQLGARVPAQFIIPRIITADGEEVQDFLARSLNAGHEGLIAKGLETPYVAGQRGFYWLKLKPVRTLDLVVLAAEWGHGRREGFLSNLHLGARDPDQGGFVMLGKTFKGLTDEMLRWQTEKLLTLEITRDEWTVFVKPEFVVEVAFNNIQESHRYPGGLTLRFARVKHFRQDKTPLDVDTIQKVRMIFESERK